MKERREYEADVFYEVWRSGGNPDAIDYDRIDDMRYAGAYPEESADVELRAQRPRRDDTEDGCPICDGGSGTPCNSHFGV